MITINVPSELDNALKIDLYNIMKRHEEDLLRRFPGLEAFVVNVAKANERIFRADAGTFASYILPADELKLTIKIEYRFSPATEKITGALVSELSAIKKKYY